MHVCLRVVLAHAALAQSDAAAISGFVKDPPGAVVANADVTISNNDTVNVVADAATIQTETATLGKPVSGEQIQSLELNGRNPFYLAQLGPGVRRGNSIAAFNFSLDDQININGSRRDDNLITIDGAVGTRTRGNGSSIGVANADSTQEVQIKFVVFNFTNHSNLDNPNVNPTSLATYGKVTAKGNTYPSDRQLQLSLRYSF